MDLDAMHKKVQALEGFKTRVESAIAFVEGLQAAGFKPTAPGAAPVLGDDDRKKIVDEVVQLLGPKVDDILKRMEAVEQRPVGGATIDLSAIEGRLTKLEGAEKPEATPEEQELSDRITVMLTWFEANREGLEVLLLLDGNVDEEKPGAGSGTDDAGTTAGVAGSLTGASGDGTSTDGTTGSVEGLPGTSQDPSKDAADATNQPAAKPLFPQADGSMGETRGT